MKRSLFFILIILSLTQCQPDNKVREEARAAAVAMAEEGPQTKAATTPTPIVPAEELAVGQTPPTVNMALGMQMGNQTVVKGETACVPIRATGFTDLIGLQFSIRWNSEELAFGDIRNLELPDLMKSNFGLTHIDKGVAVLSWIKQDLAATSLADNTRLFDICFVAKGAAGTQAKVAFAASPTPYEVITAQEEIMKFEGTDGIVSITE